MRILFAILIILSLLFPQTIDVPSINHSSNYIKVTTKIITEKDQELEQFFGKRNFPIRVSLFNSHKTFRDSCGLGENVQGVLLSNRNVIFLKTPELTATKLDEYSNLINHELIHLFHNEKMPITLFPDWFSEGIAVYLSNEFVLLQKIALSKLLLNKNLPTILQLQQIDISHSNKANSEYILSASIIEFLIQTYGNDVLLQIFQEMEQTKNFYPALKYVTKLDLSLF